MGENHKHTSLVANILHFGDNLHVLREAIPDESVDLIYLDPPFNSNAAYNVLYSNLKGTQSAAQITAFEDTWHWTDESAKALQELQQSRGELAEFLDLLVRTLGHNDLSAYLVMMAVRLVELHRTLKTTGSIYLHCDPTASHYLKAILDLLFGAEMFRNEVIWKRTGAHSSAKRWGPVHDTILYYTKSDNYTWNPLTIEHSDDYLTRYKKADPNGRRWTDDNLTGPGVRTGFSGAEWRGINPTNKGSHWKVSAKAVAAIVGEEAASKMNTIEKLDCLDANGMILWPKNAGSYPRFKRYLSGGQPIQDVIGDIPPLNSQASERLGYPTQKPIALLDRIIAASSNPGDVVLDPFCGCGTTVHAAQKLARKWIGIDITHLAISLIEKRMKTAFPGIEIEVQGLPQDLDGARNLAERDKYQFQWWACSLVGAQPYQGKKKGSDAGIDGQIFFTDADGKQTVIKKAIVSVKGGENVSAPMIRDLAGTLSANKAEIGIFISLVEPTSHMTKEAAKAGMYVSEGNGQSYPRIQILTIDELLSGRGRALYPDFSQGLASFRKAPVENKLNQLTQGTLV